MKPIQIDQIIDAKRYSTTTATLLAGNDYWDGNNYERSGRNSFLYRTPKGAYFVVEQTLWQGEQEELMPIEKDFAIELWNMFYNQRVSFEEAFPGIEVEDA